MGQALIGQLPDGVLRRSAEQRLNAALRGQSDHPARNKVKTPSPAALIHAPGSRDLLDAKADATELEYGHCTHGLGQGTAPSSGG
jgi:hypothetical protein